MKSIQKRADREDRRAKQEQKGREGSRTTGTKGTRAKDAADLFALSAAFTVHTLARSFPSVFRLRFLSSFALILSARSHLFALPSSCSPSFALSFLPTDRPAIASRSPGHTLTRAGRSPPRPALGGCHRHHIATTSPPNSDGDGRTSCPPLPHPSPSGRW